VPETYENAILLPCKGCEDKALYPNAKGGVFDNQHQPIADAFLRREYRKDIRFKGQKWDRTSGQEVKHHPLILADTIGKSTKKLAGEYIFAGYLFPHFGHFLLESLANLWHIKKHPQTPIIWLGVHNQPELDAMAESFLELYNLTNPIHILTEQTEVERLIVPEPGYLIHTRYTDEQTKALKLVDCTEPQIGKKVWLSRSRLNKGAILNEHLLEDIIAKQGWTIYHPEEHSILDQVEMLKNAETIAGVEGSAFHLLLLFPDYKGEAIIFARRQRIEFDFVHIAETLGINQSVYYPPSINWSHDLKHWEYNRFWPRLKPILDILNVKRNPNKPAPTADNLGKIYSAIIQHFQFKLSVELWSQATTININAVDCHNLIVSNQIDFNPEELPKNVDHLDISTDMFFTSQMLQKHPDLYCFRLYHDELTLIRAFNSSLTNAKAGTIWLFEYAATEREIAPENRISAELKHPSANSALLQYIADCHPMITIYRLRGSNVAIAWQQPQIMIPQASGTLKEINTSQLFDQTPIVSLNKAATKYKSFMKSITA